MTCELLTIFTPTYNRGYILPHLYRSLKNQTDKRFEWVVVDDGSSDDTEAVVSKWIQESDFRIVYVKQENQGKHIAINTGLTYSAGQLFFIVDSDDQLTSNAVEKVMEFWNSNKQEGCSGIISYRQFPDGKLVGTKLPSGLTKCKLRDCLKKYGSSGDKVVVYRTDIISKYPYPKFENEKFFGESYVFNMIDDKYDMLIMNERVYLFDYQKDGLSQDFRRLYRQNPRGMRFSMIQAFGYESTLKAKIKTLAHVGCLSLHLADMSTFFKTTNIGYSIMALPFALYLYVRIFQMKASDVKPFIESEGK